MATTKRTNLVIPEVMAAMVNAELENKMRFTNFADVDTTLVGQPGDSVTMPAYEYSGDAVVVPEGEEIPLDLLEASSRSVTIQKIAKGIELTDEALLAAFGDPKGEAARQIAMAIANGLDNSLLTALQTTSLSTKGDVKTVDTINTAIEAFNDEDLEQMVLYVNPKDASALRKAATNDWTKPAELGDDILMTGVFGELLGAQVIRTRKLAEGEAILAKRGAVKVFLKRDTLIETDRDITRKTTVLTGDKHFASYLFDESKAIKITAAGETTP